MDGVSGDSSWSLWELGMEYTGISSGLCGDVMETWGSGLEAAGIRSEVCED